MIEFDMNNKRDLELKSEYDEMVSMFKEKEHNKQIEIAKNLLKNNVDINIITSSTGLSKEEINKIKV